MTQNKFTDGQPVPAAALNALADALAGRGVVEDLDLTTGDGDFDVDVAAGTVIFPTGSVDVSSTTIDHDDSDDEDRVDLITVDTDGTVSRTAGTEAAESGKPIAPDIPDGEVLLGEVLVQGDANEIEAGDIDQDSRSVVKPEPPIGAVQEWSGAIVDIPDGWTLCDGTDPRTGKDEVPDLQDRFIVGAGDSYSVDDTGGTDEVTLTESEMPEHDHGTGSYSVGSHSHSSGTLSISVDGFGVDQVRGDLTGTVEHWQSGDDQGYLLHELSMSGATSSTSPAFSGSSGDTGGDSAHENRPPFFALAYIFRL